MEEEVIIKPFQNERTGVQNELDFIWEMNGKRIKDLGPLFQLFLYDLYGGISNYYQKVYAWKNQLPQKTDFFIRLSGDSEIKRISLKKGMKNSVHVEPISEFIHFLIEEHVPKDVIIRYLEFQYADGTRNGSGKHRMSSEEYHQQYSQEIEVMNEYFNRSQLLEKVIDRFVLMGRNDTNRVDMLVYGVPNDFIWISKEDIYHTIMEKQHLISSAPHFGPLVCQPQTRCLNRNPKYEKQRYNVQVKWYQLSDDIIENMNRIAMERKKFKV